MMQELLAEPHPCPGPADSALSLIPGCWRLGRKFTNALRKNMKSDRRQLRTVPDTLAFVQLDHDDGGRVLNISEGGLSFEAFAPVHQNGPIRFWFSLDLAKRVEAVGELVWTDVTRRVGGLRFLELSPSARNQIRNWISQSFRRNAVAAESSGSDAIAPAASSLATELVPLERHRSAAHRQFIRGMFLGILVTSAVAVPAVKYANSGKQPASPPPAASGQAALANSEPEARAPVPISVSGARRGPIASSTAGKTQRSIQAGDSPDNALGSTLVKPRPQSLDNPSAGTSHALSVALAQSRETSSARRSVASPQQLWSAVEVGNVQAALALADLYLRGDGVPASCDQARVLLLVASKKGSAQAVKKLRELDETGCPAPAP
jgi:PilZ domain-containing protein